MRCEFVDGVSGCKRGVRFVGRLKSRYVWGLINEALVYGAEGGRLVGFLLGVSARCTDSEVNTGGGGEGGGHQIRGRAKVYKQTEVIQG